MILTSLEVDPAELEARTGWTLRPEGLCKGETCVPLPGDGASLDARVLADRLGMPLVHDDTHGLWCLGPESGGWALDSAEAPDLVLPDLVTGEDLELRSLRGTKVLLVAWASW